MFAIDGEGLITLKTGVLRRIGEEEEHQDFLEFTLSDNGSGFDERLIPRLFEPGYSGFPGRVGLGLTICKRIVENHEGKILIKSIEGKGTIVTIRIPFRS
jgi:signal transduction histidine kinase